jgi:penicillin amidase
MVVGAATIVAVAIAAPLLALRGSLPAIDGRVAAPGLTAPVTVERDALGVPVITGTTRSDVAYATGYVHAQDRYFQMDLSRRMPAGRLAGSSAMQPCRPTGATACTGSRALPNACMRLCRTATAR